MHLIISVSLALSFLYVNECLLCFCLLISPFFTHAFMPRMLIRWTWCEFGWCELNPQGQIPAGQTWPLKTKWRHFVTMLGIRGHKTPWVDLFLEVFSEHLGSSSVLSPSSVPREAGQGRVENKDSGARVLAFESLPLPGGHLLSPLYKVE